MNVAVTVTATSAALVAYNVTNLVVTNSEMHFFANSTMLAGVVLYATNSISA